MSSTLHMAKRLTAPIRNYYATDNRYDRLWRHVIDTKNGIDLYTCLYPMKTCQTVYTQQLFTPVWLISSLGSKGT